MENHDALRPVQALLMSGTARPATTTPISIRIHVLLNTAATMIHEPNALLKEAVFREKQHVRPGVALQGSGNDAMGEKEGAASFILPRRGGGREGGREGGRVNVPNPQSSRAGVLDAKAMEKLGTKEGTGQEKERHDTVEGHDCRGVHTEESSSWDLRGSQDRALDGDCRDVGGVEQEHDPPFRILQHGKDATMR